MGVDARRGVRSMPSRTPSTVHGISTRNKGKRPNAKQSSPTIYDDVTMLKKASRRKMCSIKPAIVNAVARKYGHRLLGSQYTLGKNFTKKEDILVCAFMAVYWRGPGSMAPITEAYTIMDHPPWRDVSQLRCRWKEARYHASTHPPSPPCSCKRLHCAQVLLKSESIMQADDYKHLRGSLLSRPNRRDLKRFRVPHSQAPPQAQAPTEVETSIKKKRKRRNRRPKKLPTEVEEELLNLVGAAERDEMTCAPPPSPIDADIDDFVNGLFADVAQNTLEALETLDDDDDSANNTATVSRTFTPPFVPTVSDCVPKMTATKYSLYTFGSVLRVVGPTGPFNLSFSPLKSWQKRDRARLLMSTQTRMTDYHKVKKRPYTTAEEHCKVAAEKVVE